MTARFVDGAAEGWNQRREAIADAHPEPEETATRQLISNGAIATAIALLIGLARIAGLAVPGIAFMAKAWDGSSHSREHDDLIDQLNSCLTEGPGHPRRRHRPRPGQRPRYRQRSVNTSSPASSAPPADHITTTQHAYSWLRIQIGGLPGVPSSPPTPASTSFVVTPRSPAPTPSPSSRSSPATRAPQPAVRDHPLIRKVVRLPRGQYSGTVVWPRLRTAAASDAMLSFIGRSTELSDALARFDRVWWILILGGVATTLLSIPLDTKPARPALLGAPA